jgi:hypothetical protein
MPRSCRIAGALFLACLAGGVWTEPLASQPQTARAWQADADLAGVTKLTLEGLGAPQGVSLHDGKVYLYGDVWNERPRVGVLREYTLDLKPTGRFVWLRREGKPLLVHPTGLTWHEQFGTFLGDTVDKKAVIYRLDLERAWADGNLDHAVKDVIDDDAAVNGCRPEFVRLGGKDYLATADYGNFRPEVRLYDPQKLLAARRSSAPGVVAHRFLCGPFNQNLHWDAGRGQLTCVQNAVEGLGWRLDVVDLSKAVADGRSWGPGVRIRLLTLPPRDELEGYRPLEDGRALFTTSSRKDNVTLAEIKAQQPGK